MADKAAGGNGGGRVGRTAAIAGGLRQRAVRGARPGAPETTEAFARARESAADEKDAPERLAADYGLWVGKLRATATCQR